MGIPNSIPESDEREQQAESFSPHNVLHAEGFEFGTKAVRDDSLVTIASPPNGMAAIPKKRSPDQEAMAILSLSHSRVHSPSHAALRSPASSASLPPSSEVAQRPQSPLDFDYSKRPRPSTSRRKPSNSLPATMKPAYAAPWTKSGSNKGQSDHPSLLHDDDSSSRDPPLSRSDTVFENLISRDNNIRFPPRMPTASPFPSARARSRGVEQISSWIRKHGSKHVHRSASEPSTASISSVGNRNSRSSDSMSSSEGSLHRDVEGLWRQLKQSQRRVDSLKTQSTTKRSQLKELRPKLYRADNTFMNSIRPILLGHERQMLVSAEDLNSQFTELQSLREDWQDLEDSYEDLEDTVSWEEARLRRIEVHFYSILGGGNRSTDSTAEDETDERSETHEVPIELRGIPSERSLEDLHPLFLRLKQAIANLKNSKEELESLQQYKDQCGETIWLMSKANKKAPLDLRDFLNDYPPLAASKKKEISDCEREVRRLHRICEERHIMSKYMSSEMMSELYPAKAVVADITLASESTILTKSRTLTHVYFTELLSAPDHLIRDMGPLDESSAAEGSDSARQNATPLTPHIEKQMAKENAINKLLRTRNDRSHNDFVNRWLLFALRTSPLEIVRLYNTFTSLLSIRDVLHWQYDVLRFWFNDNTADSAEELHLTGEHSEYYLRLATPARSRAASEGVTSMKISEFHRRPYGGGARSAKTL